MLAQLITKLGRILKSRVNPAGWSRKRYEQLQMETAYFSSVASDRDEHINDACSLDGGRSRYAEFSG